MSLGCFKLSGCKNYEPRKFATQKQHDIGQEDKNVKHCTNGCWFSVFVCSVVKLLTQANICHFWVKLFVPVKISFYRTKSCYKLSKVI